MKKKRVNKNKHKYNNINVYKKIKEEKIINLENRINIIKENKLKKKIVLNKYYKIIRIILLIIFLSLIIYSSYKLLYFKKELIVIEEEKEKLIEEVIELPILEEKEIERIEDIKIDFNKLKEINSDTIGWMIFNKKYVNNPIVKTTNNEYYLNNSFKKVPNSVGTIFVDYRNNGLNDENTIIFGHHTPNETMFGSLKDVFNSEFFNEDNDDLIYIFDINNKLRKYKIFSYYIIEKEEYYITPTFDNLEEYQVFINTIKKRSFRNLGIDVTTKDKILTLSTCAGPSGTSKRRVIHAKLIED